MALDYDAAPPNLTPSEQKAFRWACGGIEPDDPEAADDLVADLLERLEKQAPTLVEGWRDDPEARGFAQAAKRAAKKVRALHSRHGAE